MMKPFSIFCLLLLLYAGKEAQAASCTGPVLPRQVAVTQSDSLVQPKPIFKNKAASASVITGGIAAFLSVLGVATLNTWEFGGAGVLFGAILGIVALITGSVGLDRRKRMLQTNPQPSEANFPDFGRGKANAGILLGLIGIGVLAGLIVVIAAW